MDKQEHAIDTLYILGNGFDVASGLKTKFSDFKRWFESNDPVGYGYFCALMEINTDDEWQHLEESLAKPFSKESRLYGTVRELFRSGMDEGLLDDDPTGESLTLYIIDELSRQYDRAPWDLYSLVISTLNERFAEWIKTIDVEIGPKRKRDEGIDRLLFQSGYFANFNVSVKSSTPSV